MRRFRVVGGLLWAVASLLLAAGLWAGLRAAPGLSPFVLESLRVEGVKRTPAGRVLEVAGIRPGLGFFQVNVQEVRRAVETLPWVRRARVLRQLPSTLTVAVEEWEPAYLVRLDRLYYLTREGRVIRAPVDQGLDYPVVTGLSWADLEAPGPRQAELLALLACLAKNLPAERVSEVHFDAGEGFTVYAGEEPPQGIFLGEGDLEEKFSRLARVRRHLEKRGQVARTLNLAYEDKIIACLATAGGEEQGP